MPIYEYLCETCGDKFEVRQKFADEALTVHENCGGAVHRLLSAPALMFKGTGWYVTDYAKGNGGGSARSSNSHGSSESKSESKSEAKTESKSESKTSDSGSTSSTSSTSDKK